MATLQDERWTFGHALHVENIDIVNPFARNTLYSKIHLNGGASNWVLASVPTPNVTEGWKISYVILRYAIRGAGPESGFIDKIGVRDGNEVVSEVEGLDIGRTPQGGWQTVIVSRLSPPKPFKYGLGVSIHVNYPVKPTDPSWPSFPPTEFLFASVGLGFVRESSTGLPIKAKTKAKTKKRHP